MMNIGWTVAYWMLAAVIVACYGLVADNLYTLIRDFRAGRTHQLGDRRAMGANARYPGK